MNVWKRLVSGSHDRASRLHDLQGRRVSASRFFRHAGPALVSGIGRIFFGHRPAKPWISYDASRYLALRLNTTQSRILEFGSGMSTIWYARHARQVVSIEDYRPWYDKVLALMAQWNVNNVTYLYASDAQSYIDLAREHEETGFDLVMIDGSVRSLCADFALSILKKGQMVYVDNADMGPDATDAAEKLIAYAKAHGSTLQRFTDFAPTQLFVQSGLLLTA